MLKALLTDCPRPGFTPTQRIPVVAVADGLLFLMQYKV